MSLGGPKQHVRLRRQWKKPLCIQHAVAQRPGKIQHLVLDGDFFHSLLRLAVKRRGTAAMLRATERSVGEMLAREQEIDK